MRHRIAGLTILAWLLVGCGSSDSPPPRDQTVSELALAGNLVLGDVPTTFSGAGWRWTMVSIKRTDPARFPTDHCYVDRSLIGRPRSTIAFVVEVQNVAETEQSIGLADFRIRTDCGLEVSGRVVSLSGQSSFQTLSTGSRAQYGVIRDRRM